jgi:hypothetical protein
MNTLSGPDLRANGPHQLIDAFCLWPDFRQPQALHRLRLLGAIKTNSRPSNCYPPRASCSDIESEAYRQRKEVLATYRMLMQSSEGKDPQTLALLPSAVHSLFGASLPTISASIVPNYISLINHTPSRLAASTFQVLLGPGGSPLIYCPHAPCVVDRNLRAFPNNNEEINYAAYMKLYVPLRVTVKSLQTPAPHDQHNVPDCPARS